MYTDVVTTIITIITIISKEAINFNAFNLCKTLILLRRITYNYNYVVIKNDCDIHN